MASAAQPQRESPRRGSVPVRPETEAAYPRNSPPAGATVRPAAALNARSAAALQRQAGNRAVSHLLSRPSGQRPSGLPPGHAAEPQRGAASIAGSGGVIDRPVVQMLLQRAVDCPPAPVAPEPVAPGDDPRFAKVTGQVKEVSVEEKAHAPVSAKVAEAQGAAAGPPNEMAAQAGAAQVDQMAAAKPGTFDKAAFIAAVANAIDAASPKNLDEADKLRDSGKSAQVKDQVAGMVTKNKEGSAQDIKAATAATPDTSGITPKPVAPMTSEQPGPPPRPVPADQAMPAERGPDQTNLAGGPCALDAKMADAKVTDEQLAKSNEPQFTKALDAKQNVATQAVQAPDQVKAAEAQQLAQAQAGAVGSVTTGLTAMHADRVGALGGVGAHKEQAKAADEAKRAEISAHIEAVFTKTKSDVGAVLDGLDKKVAAIFDDGEKNARESFDANVGRDIAAWKDERYSGITGAGQWVADKFAGVPPEVNEIFARSRTAYLAQMQKVISDVADTVGAELGKAKQLIADGRAEVKTYVTSQPAALRQFASEAGEKMSGQFASLDSDVNSKQDSVVSDLAQKYVTARESVDASITKMQEENKGLVDEAEAEVGGAIETILKLKDWIEHTAQRIAGSVDKILADPITFLSKLVNAVEHGFTSFVQNIWTHLEHGFKDYLLGTLGSAGIRIPDELDFKGTLMMLVDLFGLTWEHIKGRILQKLGPKAGKLWHLIEQGIEFVKTIAEKGLEGIWETLVGKIGALEEMVIEKIKSFVVTEVVQKGIEWVLSLCNPAGAFVQAVEMIVHVVEFFVDKGKQIQETVDRILGSVEALLSGGEGGVPALIEQTLAKSIPTIIAFLADLAGLGGIADTIKEMVNSARSLVDKGIDWVVDKVIQLVKNAWAALTGKGDDRKQSKSPDAVEDEAVDQLIEAEGSLTDISAARAKAAAIQQSLAPQGLKSMDLPERDEESGFDIVVVAQRAAKGQGMWTGKKRAAVTADADVSFEEPADTSQYSFAKVAAKDDQDRVVMNPDGSPLMVPSQPATIWGGMVRPSKQGAKSLEVKTWSGEVLADWRDNRSHAEHNFVGWARNHMKLQPIDEIVLKIRGRWPCKNCASELSGLGETILLANQTAKLVLDVSPTATNWKQEWSSPEECRAALSPWEVPPETLITGKPLKIKKK